MNVDKTQNSFGPSRNPKVDQTKWLGKKANTKKKKRIKRELNLLKSSLLLSSFRAKKVRRTRLKKPYSVDTNLTASSSFMPMRFNALEGTMIDRPERYRPSPKAGKSAAGFDSAIHFVSAA